MSGTAKPTKRLKRLAAIDGPEPSLKFEFTLRCSYFEADIAACCSRPLSLAE